MHRLNSKGGRTNKHCVRIGCRLCVYVCVFAVRSSHPDSQLFMCVNAMSCWSCLSSSVFVTWFCVPWNELPFDWWTISFPVWPDVHHTCFSLTSHTSHSDQRRYKKASFTFPMDFEWEGIWTWRRWYSNRQRAFTQCQLRCINFDTGSDVILIRPDDWFPNQWFGLQRGFFGFDFVFLSIRLLSGCCCWLDDRQKWLSTSEMLDERLPFSHSSSFLSGLRSTSACNSSGE